ncbi:SRPBCC family protein [Nesterenkonia muleiensis]|uniref:SRPBCC family protein n=1 Tax=Nesterenkonia muleiensis TaxID=2282648 RepID=UPI000E73C8DE|nr:SRPBCC domain-containing protein [Nesterenkonia muleiensis]
MPVEKDENGQRRVQAEVDVPGTPEEVWQAIATGEGISSWFVPTRSDERTGGEVVNSFGPGMDSVARITHWDPPTSYTATAQEATEAEAQDGPGSIATEWIVEARDDSTCVVRVVHRWFADSDEWDGEFEGHAYGWASSYFRMLRLYLEHFAGQTCSAFDLAAFSKSTPPQTWATLAEAFSIDESSLRVESAPGAPKLSGVQQSTEITDPALLRVRETSPLIKATLEGMDGTEPELLLRLERPAPGFAHLFIMPMGEQTMVSLRVFLFGDEGTEIASDLESTWNHWLTTRFPPEELPHETP